MQLSDLTVYLIGAGALVLLALLVHGAWLGRKLDPRFIPVLSPFGTLDSFAHQGDARALRNGPDVVVHPGLSQDQGGSAAIEALIRPVSQWPEPLSRQDWRIEPVIDVMVPIDLETAVPGNLVLQHLPVKHWVGSKIFIVEGLNSVTQQWERLAEKPLYLELRAGLTLSNRMGPLNQIEYSEFVQKIEVLVQAIGGMANFPDMLDVMAQAQHLEAFASAHDVQLAVYLVAQSEAWSLAFIEQQAVKQGFQLTSQRGCWVMPATKHNTPPMLLLHVGKASTAQALSAANKESNPASITVLTLIFDVPQSPTQDNGFVMWQEVAQTLSTSLGAVTCDVFEQSLNAAGFAAIGEQLQDLYEALDNEGLSAGSLAAQRLFS